MLTVQVKFKGNLQQMEKYIKVKPKSNQFKICDKKKKKTRRN